MDTGHELELQTAVLNTIGEGMTFEAIRDDTDVRKAAEVEWLYAGVVRRAIFRLEEDGLVVAHRNDEGKLVYSRRSKAGV